MDQATVTDLSKYPLAMTPEQAGEVLGLKRNSIYKALKTGQVPSVRIGRLIKVPRAAVERMLAEAGTK